MTANASLLIFQPIPIRALKEHCTFLARVQPTVDCQRL